MELRRLRLLNELARLGTVAAVAEALSYSASSVSVALHELEREAGSTLLRRVGRNVELTPAGRRLADYAADALAADEAILAELATADDRPRGRLRMTMVGTPALALLPDTMARLTERAPDLHVEVYDIETAPALEQLESRSVDLVVGVEYDPLPVPRRPGIVRHDLLREAMMLVLHPDHRALARPGAVSLTDLRRSHWATGHLGSGLDALVRNRCNLLGGYEPEVRHRSNGGYVLGAMVASGLAVSLLPILFTGTQPQIVARPVARRTAAAHHLHRRPRLQRHAGRARRPRCTARHRARHRRREHRDRGHGMNPDVEIGGRVCRVSVVGPSSCGPSIPA